MKSRIIFILIFSFPELCFCQTDNISSGRALTFNGINAYLEIGHSYSTINLPFSISAWIYLDPSMTNAAPIFVTNDNDPNYRGFWFFVTSTSIWCEFGDGTGGNNPAFRRGKLATIPNIGGRWVNIQAVMRGAFDISLYVNGIDVGGSSSGLSNLPMVSSYSNDTAKIGYFFSNGVKYYFNGVIDEVRLWNRSLTLDEIRQGMCKKLIGNEPGLIGYWNFDETSGNTAYDKSPNKFNGQFAGSPTRVYSGAPIGDISVNLYPSSWNGISLTFSESNNKITVNNVIGPPGGCHLYAVRNSPSQTNGINPSNSENLYFGVFMASLNTGNKFNVAYTFNDTNPCLFERQDNSNSTWGTSILPLNGKSQRIELIKGSGNQIIVNLGPDQTLCDQTNYTLNPGNIPAGTTILWNTGQTTPTIQINKSGKYWVQVSSACTLALDTINVRFLTTPLPISLGNDVLSCKISNTILKPTINETDLDYTWQDGSKQTSFEVKEFGLYWLTVKNACGMKSDTILFSKISEQQISLNLGSDKILCNQTNYTLNPGNTPASTTFLWSTGQTTPTIQINKSGKYWLKASSSCEVGSDTIIVQFLKTPTPFSFGADIESCKVSPTILKPAVDDFGVDYTWQDGTKQSSFEVKDFGKYWVSVKNICGQTSDTIKFTKISITSSFIPNLITPNGDAFNQYFQLDSKLSGLISLLVVNRWGHEVYFSNSYKNDWDGGDLANGVYFGILTGECIEKTKTPITIIR